MELVSALDHALLGWFISARPAWLHGAVAVYSELTRPAWLLVGSLVIATVAVVRAHAFRWLYLPVTLAVANLASHLLKPLIGRARPDPDVQLVTHLSPALPSGHATGAIAFALALFLLLGARHRWLGAIVWALAVATCASRLYLGVHWPSDVLAGAVLGAAVAAVLWFLLPGDWRSVRCSVTRPRNV